MPHLRASIVAVIVAHLVAAAQGQPASSPSPEMPMADYLALLAQIAPAAREGAEAYLQAVQQQCRKTLTSAQLRRALSEGSGDSVLMGMIRASQLRDAKSMAALTQRLDCRSLQ